MRPLYSSYSLLTLIGACCLLFGACKKSAQPAGVVTTGHHVYIAGDNGTFPVLWTDDSAQVLSTSPGSASQVVISGADVYVAGTAGENGVVTPEGPSGIYVYWKNGRQGDVGDTLLLLASSSIAVAGGRLYYAYGPLWANGSLWAQQGQGMIGRVLEVFAAGNDIYAVGSDNANTPVYWKNGQRTIVTQGNPLVSYPAVYSIYVSGNDVYVGGIDYGGKAAYWKNGVLNELQPSDPTTYVSQARSIFVSGNDVYVVGNFYSPTSYIQPAYWKNGMQHNLPLNGANYGVANDIYVTDSTVYVVGTTSAGAVCWKNGVETVLAQNGSANSLIVQ